VDWGTLLGTALGALVGIGSTVLVDYSRWKRDQRAQEHTGRREVYSQYLSALSLATHQLNDLWRHGSLTPDERKRKAGEILTASGAYQLRYKMLITAPEVLEGAIERAFVCLRNLRDRLDEYQESKDLWDGAIAAMSDAIAVLRRAMRDDLSEVVLAGAAGSMVARQGS
jgi:hypothetical protein